MRELRWPWPSQKKRRKGAIQSQATRSHQFRVPDTGWEFFFTSRRWEENPYFGNPNRHINHDWYIYGGLVAPCLHWLGALLRWGLMNYIRDTATTTYWLGPTAHLCWDRLRNKSRFLSVTKGVMIQAQSWIFLLLIRRQLSCLGLLIKCAGLMY